MEKDFDIMPIVSQLNSYTLAQTKKLQKELKKGHEDDMLFAFNDHVNIIYQQKAYKSLYQLVKDRLIKANREEYTENGKQVLVSYNIPLPNNLVDLLSYDDMVAFFFLIVDFFRQTFGKENILSAIIHFEDQHPHLHLQHFPINPETHQLGASVIKSKKKYIEQALNAYMDATDFYTPFLYTEETPDAFLNADCLSANLFESIPLDFSNI